MSLHFILGGSGSGKSTLLYRQMIAQSLAHPERKYLVIVPEQSTLQTTREIILQHPAKGILNIDVLSFNRLSYRVFDEAGAGVNPVLTETGKNLVLRKCAANIRDSLPWLGAKLDRQGYISQVKSVLSELAQYEVTPQMLGGLAGGGEKQSLFRMKISDLALLQEAFDEAKRDLYITAEEVPALLARFAGQSGLLKDCVLAFDGFTGFTPVQMTAMRSLMRCASDTWVTMNIGPGEEVFGRVYEHELFSLSKRTIQALVKMASELGITVEDFVWADPDAGRHIPGSELFRLENCFLRSGAAGRPGCRHETKRQVWIRHLADPVREAAYAASVVLSLIHEEGYALRDIGIVCSDPGIYADHLSRAFDRVHIPHFIDRKEPVLMNPCLEFIRAALEMAGAGFSYASVMRFLRTGFAGVGREDADLLENYLLAAGVRSWSGWKKTWARSVRSLTAEELEHVNALRESFVESLGGFMEVFKAREASLHDYTAALRALLEAFGVEEKLSLEEYRPAGLSASASARKAMEYDHVYESVMQVLEEADTLLGKSHVSRDEFARILEAGFDQAQIGMLPPVLDQVYVGDMMRTRLGNVKALLFLGMNEGLIPARPSAGGLLSEMDREKLRECGISLSPSMREDACIQRYYLYLSLTRPSRRLYLTWAGSDIQGNPLSPSPLLREVTRILPGAADEDMAGPEETQNIAGKTGFFSMDDVAFSASLRLGRGEKPEKEAALRVMMDALEKSGDRALLSGARQEAGMRCSSEQIGEESASALYGPGFAGSVSRMDTFADCPFRHFLTYGLRVREREEFTVRTLDTGTLFHDALERFGRRLGPAGEYDWRGIDDARAQALARSCVEESAQELFGGLFSDTRRNQYVLNRVADILGAGVWGMLRQVRAGDLTPAYFETSFRDQGVRGKIDRIDVYEHEGKVYASIIDYKSGRTGFDPALIYDGKTLQLPLYLGRSMEFLEKRYPGREIVPAGILYQHLREPLLMAQAGAFPSGEELEKNLLKELRPDGIVNSDPLVLDAYAHDEEIRSLIIPAPRYKKDGTLYKSSPPAVTKTQFAGIAAFADRKMQELKGRIGRGVIAAEPYRDGKSLACGYCPYRSACMFDLRLPGARCRMKTNLPVEEILKRIAEQGTVPRSGF